MSSETTLAVEGLSKHYGEIKAVESVSFEIAEGDIFGFLGPNGAGKTTTIRTILGHLKPTAGKIKIFGQEIVPLKNVEIRKKISYLPGDLGLYSELSVRENIKHFGRLSKIKIKWEIIEDYAGRLNLALERRVGELSKGNRQKVGIILGLMGDFELIFMDEPTAGLDPLMQAKFEEILKEKQEETNCTVFLSSHILSEVEKLCNRVAIINAGKIIETSTIHELKMKHLKQFSLGFATEEGMDKFITHLQTTYPDAVITSKVSTQLVFDLPPEHKFAMLESIMKDWGGNKIFDFSINDASLERIFMKYYAGGQT